VKRALVFLLFLAARVPLLFLRQPFFDELYTQWITAKSFAGILDALRYDSGPPLYYWLLHLLGAPTVYTARCLSLVFSAVGLVAVLGAEKLGPSRYAAAALIAVFPPAVLFSVDARAYALCAMFVTIGIVALVYDRPWIAAAAFVLAGYTQYYGVLFFPLLARRWRALAVAIVLFIPGFLMAWHQPTSAIEWMRLGTYPDALFVRPTLALLLVTVALAIASIKPSWQALWTLVPFALAVCTFVYVPLRFEVLVAAPLLIWLAQSRRTVALVGLGAAFAAWTAIGIVEHARRPVDDYRAAANWVAQNVPADDRVVASGYLYLETVSQRPAVAYPVQQAQHPGWRVWRGPGSPPPPGMFTWIGERGAPELEEIRRSRRIELLYANARALVVKVH
jgi:hypothetical protein